MIWWIVALLVVLGLALYAAWLWRRVWHRQQRRLAQTQARQGMLVDQLEVLARAVVQQQVNVTEGALRLSALLDLLVVSPAQPVDLAAIHRLAEAASSLAIGARRQALPRPERRAQDRQREALEAEQGEAVTNAARRLLEALPRWR
ncbi:hypothetical protein S7S_09645 [Isoalcanivorax pacificus W11-5]|uniref:DUF2489 domain-containing protein n=1 Tax=Isoalcanivorax pacificus W11-5 TaxID=391936 RepID=A0A0B4XMI9_9GAMM|nr:DUF2489 domain-containing protein [Isoalcanivorax pacificus]AJD48341.1 hypothetical protein S7S_09645 [Isoalcanivorax pacificus W11-5]